MCGYQARQPISWVTSVIAQLTRETVLARTADVEDLVIIAYVGLLDNPDPTEVSQERLLTRCRSTIVTWAWEQGQHDEQPPAPSRPAPTVRRESAGAPCGALLSR